MEMKGTHLIPAPRDVVWAALNDPEYTAHILDTNATERQRILDGVAAMGLGTMDSVTNFIPVDVGRDAGPVVKGLRDRRVRVAGFGYEAAGNYIRVSTGTAEDTDAFLAALREVLEEVPAAP